MLKKFSLIIILFLLSPTISFAEIPHYVDFKYILNQSDAGKKAQTTLKNRLDKGIKDLQSKEKKILDEEKIIQQKNNFTRRIQKKVSVRAKVSSLQKKEIH